MGGGDANKSLLFFFACFQVVAVSGLVSWTLV